jgi:stage V sporulation protein K
MFIFHIVTIVFVVLLILNGFGNVWANGILERLLSKPDDFKEIIVHLIVPVSLIASFVHLASSALPSVDDEDDNSKDSSTKLSDEQKKKIDEAIKNAQSSQSESTEPLANIIGLDSVKKQVQDLKHFIVAQGKRRVAGLPTQNINLHLVFTGNPGTGKTTVAREIAKIYKNYGLLKKGQLVETDRAGLVSEYLGQTAIKTTEAVDRAMGGVLFIDEAYSLLGDQYGKEAIDTLLKIMEDKKGKIAVIVAGYPNEMENFVNSNPGLKSRFGRILNFPDYNHTELLQIFELFCTKECYKISDDARNKLAQHFVSSAPTGEKGFGNGRYVRNVFEYIIVKQSERTTHEDINDAEELQKITADDIDKVFT